MLIVCNKNDDRRATRGSELLVRDHARKVFNINIDIVKLVIFELVSLRLAVLFGLGHPLTPSPRRSVPPQERIALLGRPVVYPVHACFRVLRRLVVERPIGRSLPHRDVGSLVGDDDALGRVVVLPQGLRREIVVLRSALAWKVPSNALEHALAPSSTC